MKGIQIAFASIAAGKRRLCVPFTGSFGEIILDRVFIL
jgi:hypothetical protein